MIDEKKLIELLKTLYRQDDFVKISRIEKLINQQSKIKDELRPCTVKTTSELPVIGNQCANYVSKTEIHSAYFHTWINGCNGFGIVEYEDGTVQRILPECITFTDRDGEQNEN